MTEPAPPWAPLGDVAEANLAAIRRAGHHIADLVHHDHGDTPAIPTTPTMQETPVTKLGGLADGLAQLACNKLIEDLAEAGVGQLLQPHERQAVVTLARTLDDAHKPQTAPLPQRTPGPVTP